MVLPAYSLAIQKEKVENISCSSIKNGKEIKLICFNLHHEKIKDLGPELLGLI